MIVEQRLSRCVTPQALAAELARASWCRELYEVEHVCSYLGTSGDRMLCVFSAPDAEAVRVVARRMGYGYERIWAAEVVPLLTAEVPGS